MSDVQDHPFDLSTDYFSLYSFPRAFELDHKSLKARYLELQQQHHPDRYANDSESEQRKAVQRTAHLNHAYQSLKSPLKRAIYMLELAGVSFDADSKTHTDVNFLMAQLELREKLEALGNAEDPFADLEALESQAQQEYADYQAEFVVHYDSKDWNSAIESIHKLMFASKLLEEIRSKEEVLED
jgi:molecular chaperone HscB